MGKLVKSNLNTHNAKQFVESLDESANSLYYVYLGKHTPFSDDNNPPTANNSEEDSFYQQYRDMIYGKQITTSDIKHMVNKNAWANGTVYPMYKNTDGNLRANNFFVSVEEANGNFSVFKCLFNNKESASTDQPTLSETAANDDVYITTADKYQWKYMYELTEAEHTKFSTTDKIPLVIDTNVTGNAVSGAIDVVSVNNGGTRYNSVANGVVKDASVGGNNLIIELESLVSANVTIANTTAAGSNTALEVERVDLFGKFANGDLYNSNTDPNTSNSVANGVIVSANSTVLKIVDVAGNFFGANSTNVVLKGQSTEVLTQVSSIASDTSTISSNTDFYKGCSFYIADGTGKGQQKTISEYIVTGSARRVLIANAFTTSIDTTSRFEITPRVVIAGDGSGAEGRAIVNTVNFSVDTIEMTNRGSGYTFASAQVLGNTGIVESGTTAQANNANVTPIIGPPGGHGSDPINELYADTVGVSVDFVDDEGGNTPAQNDFRTVGILKDPLFANVVLTMNTSTSNSGTSFTAGEKVTQDSNSTHGGAFGFITSRASGTLNLANVYGQFHSGLRITGADSTKTANVLSITTSDKSTSNASTFDQRLRLTGFVNTSSFAFTTDETIKQDSTDANGAIHFINTSSGAVMSITNKKGNFLATDTTSGTFYYVRGQTSGAVGYFTDTAGPDIVPNSGEVMYVENVSPITRDDSQTERIKVMIKF